MDMDMDLRTAVRSGLVPPEQVARIMRMHQGFEVVGIGTDEDVHVIINGSSCCSYDIRYRNGSLTCSCPDAARGSADFCKHLCWFLLAVGKGGAPVLLGDPAALDATAFRARDTLLADIRQDQTRFEPAEDRMQEDCPICYQCLEETKACIKCPSCSQPFHIHCIFEWHAHDATCPMCRGRDWGRSFAPLRLRNDHFVAFTR